MTETDILLQNSINRFTQTTRRTRGSIQRTIGVTKEHYQQFFSESGTSRKALLADKEHEQRAIATSREFNQAYNEISQLISKVIDRKTTTRTAAKKVKTKKSRDETVNRSIK